MTSSQNEMSVLTQDRSLDSLRASRLSFPVIHKLISFRTSGVVFDSVLFVLLMFCFGLLFLLPST